MKFSLPNHKTLLFAILVIAFALRAVYAIYSYQNNVQDHFKDDIAYYNLAEEILSQGPLYLDLSKFYKGEAGVVGPFIGWVMAIIFLIFGKNWLIIFLINSALATLSVFILYKVGKKIFNVQVALLAASWAAIYLPWVKSIPSAGKDIWIILLSLVMFGQFIKYSLEKHTIKQMFYMILTYVILMHIDERYLTYGFILILPVFFISELPWKKKIIHMSLAGFLTILLITPWTIRNYMLYDKVVILSIRTIGITDPLFGYGYPEYTDKSLQSDNYKSRNYLSPAQIDSIQNDLTVFHRKTFPKNQLEAIKSGIIPRYLSQNEMYASRFVELWRPCAFKPYFWEDGYRFGQWSLKHNLMLLVSYGILLPFFLIGLFLLWRRNKFWTFLIVLFPLWHTLIHILFIPYARYRYRLPIDSIVILVSIFCIYYIYLVLIKKKSLNLNFMKD